MDTILSYSIFLFMYLIIVVLIWWGFFGYLLLLLFFSIFTKANGTRKKIDNYPFITILIPCYNEESWVDKKVGNLAEIDYPKDKLEIVFADGNSKDQTVEKLEAKIKDFPYMKVIQTGCKGKIQQINYILQNTQSDLIINTDMDTVLQKDTVEKLVKEFEDPDVYVVGAYILPNTSLDIEKQYWENQNNFRVLESEVYSASIVIAPCYAYRKQLLPSFPEDCVADDIYVAYLANTMGKRSIYLKDAIAYEERTPSTFAELLNHKFRKANAFIIEQLRFIYMLPRMRNRWKLIFLSKLLQIIFMPWLLIAYFLSTIILLVDEMDFATGSFELGIGFYFVIGALIFLFLSFLVCHLLVERKRTYFIDLRYKRRSNLAIFLLVNLILFIAGISYPFYAQTSNYSKVQ